MANYHMAQDLDEEPVTRSNIDAVRRTLGAAAEEAGIVEGSVVSHWRLQHAGGRLGAWQEGAALAGYLTVDHQRHVSVLALGDEILRGTYDDDTVRLKGELSFRLKPYSLEEIDGSN